MRKYRLKIIAILLLLAVVSLTFLRESIFVEINAIIDGHRFNKAYFHVFDEDILSLNSSEIQLLKWELTIVFILLISIFTILSIHYWFMKKEYTMYTVKMYVVVTSVIVLLTLLLFGLGIFFEYYFLLRKMIGFLQSPIPFFLLFSVYYSISLKREE